MAEWAVSLADSEINRMKSSTWLLMMTVVAIIASVWMLHMGLEMRRMDEMLSRHVQKNAMLLQAALVAGVGTRQAFINHQDAQTIASWNLDPCLTDGQVERPEGIRPRLMQDANVCEKAWNGLRASNAAPAPSEATLANAARLAQQCLVSAQSTHETITQNFLQAAGCDTSRPLEMALSNSESLAARRPL